MTDFTHARLLCLGESLRSFLLPSATFHTYHTPVQQPDVPVWASDEWATPAMSLILWIVLIPGQSEVWRDSNGKCL